jgi:hypothetical protein
VVINTVIMSDSESYPGAAYILSLVGGLFVLLAGVLVGLIGAALTFMVGGLGAIAGLFGVVWGVIIIVAAFSLRANPSQHVTWGVIIIVFSLLSWVGSFGGFFIGFLLSLIGGIMAIVWSPQTYGTHDAYVPPTQVNPKSSASAQFCPYCGNSLPADVVYCPHCGKQIQ